MKKESFLDFWKKLFPEQQTLVREEVLRQIDDAKEGQLSSRPDKEMVGYQNKVAGVYGAYERAQFQLATMDHILAHVKFPCETLVSLGSGPASYELWLLTQGMVNQVILIDHSAAMLQRAQQIANDIGVGGKVETICKDMRENDLPPKSADLVFCINAMHWSKIWERWIFESARLAKDGAEAFLTCSLMAPRSGITPQTIGRAAKKWFNLTHQDFLLPPNPQVVGGMMAISSRYVVVGRRKRRV